MCVRFVERWVPTTAHVVPWQFADLEGLGVTRSAAVAAVQWVEPGRMPLAGPAAIARLLLTSALAWRPVGFVLSLRPVTALAWPVYRLVARHRHRLPGGSAACAVRPDPGP